MRLFIAAIALLGLVGAWGKLKADDARAVAATGDRLAAPVAGAPRLTLGGALTRGSFHFGRPVMREDAIAVPQTSDPAHSGNPSVAPLKWVGMVINPTPTAQDPNLVYECTGEFITANVVLTAGHCVRDLVESPTGPWFDLTKQTFVLQYQNGQGSHVFHTVCAATPPLWTFPSNYKSLSADDQDAALLVASQHDFAMILVDGASPTGFMPFQLDWKGQYVGATRVGYAGDILDGEIIQQSHGIVFFADAIPMFSQSYPGLMVHWQSLTDLTSGTSGGAWIANFDPSQTAGNNVLLAVTSFSNDAYPGAEFGAYLQAADFHPLLQYVSNGCK